MDENIFLLLLSGNINVVMIVRFITATSAQLSHCEILSCFYTVIHHCALFIQIHHISEEFAITLFTLYICARFVCLNYLNTSFIIWFTHINVWWQKLSAACYKPWNSETRYDLVNPLLQSKKNPCNLQ